MTGFSASAGKVAMASTWVFTSLSTSFRSSPWATCPHGAHTLGGSGTDLDDAVDILDGLLDLDHHPLFHFLGRGAEVGHPYDDRVHLEVGRGLLADGEGRDDAEGDDQEHQQVRRNVIAGEPGDEALLV